MPTALRYTESADSDKFDVFIGDVVRVTEDSKNKFLNKMQTEAKDAVLRHIPRSAYTHGRRGKERVHLADDVESALVPDDDFGGRRVRTRGGKKTGSLWHIVSDGTYRSKANHFMDKAMGDIEKKIDAALDEAMRDV